MTVSSCKSAKFEMEICYITFTSYKGINVDILDHYVNQSLHIVHDTNHICLHNIQMWEGFPCFKVKTEGYRIIHCIK